MKKLRSVRDIALKILLDVDNSNARANELLDIAIEKSSINEYDRAFLTELVYGTIRWQGNADWVMAQFIKPSQFKKLQPEIKICLRLGIYQILHLKGIADYAIVNESVEIAKKYGNKGSAGFVNAVLRNISRSKDNISYPDINKNPIKHISVCYSHPEWMVDRWVKRYGVEQTIALCSANNMRPRLFLRTNTLRASRLQLIESLEKEGISASPSKNLPESIEIINLNIPLKSFSSYKEGLFQVQDESSMLIGHILDPKPNEFIIDACSAPGGKSTHIAEIMQNRGRVLAYDINEKRLNMLKENCQRLGIGIIETIIADVRKINDNLKAKADRVFVDAPCTGLGVLSRRVESRWRRTPDQIAEFAKIQYEILESVSEYVKLDGILVYCTCTIEPEENQQVLEKFLKLHPEFQIQNILPFLPEGANQLDGIVSKEGYLQTYPHIHNIDGFFAVRMIRAS